MIPPYPAACQRLPEADPTFPYLCLYSCSGRKYNTRVDSDLKQNSDYVSVRIGMCSDRFCFHVFFRVSRNGTTAVYQVSITSYFVLLYVSIMICTARRMYQVPGSLQHTSMYARQHLRRTIVGS